MYTKIRKYMKKKFFFKAREVRNKLLEKERIVKCAYQFTKTFCSSNALRNIWKEKPKNEYFVRYFFLIENVHIYAQQLFRGSFLGGSSLCYCLPLTL